MESFFHFSSLDTYHKSNSYYSFMDYLLKYLSFNIDRCIKRHINSVSVIWYVSILLHFKRYRNQYRKILICCEMVLRIRKSKQIRKIALDELRFTLPMTIDIAKMAIQSTGISCRYLYILDACYGNRYT